MKIRQLTVAIYFHSIFLLWKSMAAVNCLLAFFKKYLHLCSTEERNSYRFGTTSVWV